MLEGGVLIGYCEISTSHKNPNQEATQGEV